MEIKVEAGDITQHPAKAVIVNLFEGVTRPAGATGAVDQALGGGISRLIEEGEIKGKQGEITLIHTLDRMPSPRVIVAGLGKQEAFSLNVIRDLMGSGLRRARSAGAKSVATIVHGAGIAGLDPEACAQAIAEAAVMGTYRFRRYKQNGDGDSSDVETLHIVESDDAKLEALRRGVAHGQVLGQAATWLTSRPTRYHRPLSPNAPKPWPPTPAWNATSCTRVSWRSWGWARCSASASAPRSRRASSSLSTADGRIASRRWGCWARGSPSTPAASPSSRRPAWRR